MPLQTMINLLFPPQCLMCETFVETQGGLCPTCWQETEFLSGPTCDQCAQPLPGLNADETLLCDACMTTPRLWAKGRAVMRYAGKGRAMTLALKHGDRTDIAPAAAAMMARSLGGIVTPDTHIIPVPLHWQRLAKRRYNQSALLAKSLAVQTGAIYAPDALRRLRATQSLDGLNRDARAEELHGAIAPNMDISGPVLLVDDVLTSGATLTACTHAAQLAGASEVNVAVLARVASET